MFACLSCYCQNEEGASNEFRRFMILDFMLAKIEQDSLHKKRPAHDKLQLVLFAEGHLKVIQQIDSLEKYDLLTEKLLWRVRELKTKLAN